MSRFNFIYAETELTHRAKAVYIYLRDRANGNDICWPRSKPLRESCSSPAAPCRGRLPIWNARG